jgi:hypothetical protein
MAQKHADSADPDSQHCNELVRKYGKEPKIGNKKLLWTDSWVYGTGTVPVPEVYKTAASAVAQARTVQVPHMSRQPTINKPEHMQEQ